jgi:hypothetical protein
MQNPASNWIMPRPVARALPRHDHERVAVETFWIEDSLLILALHRLLQVLVPSHTCRLLVRHERIPHRERQLVDRCVGAPDFLRYAFLSLRLAALDLELAPAVYGE